MARFTGGWIKLWRKAVEGDLAQNAYLWALWNWLLYAATWKPTSIIWQGKRRDIPPGTVILGIKEIAEKWDCSQSTVKKWLTYLQSSERIALETSSRGTLITVLNWNTYQSSDSERREPSENEVGAECDQSENEVGLNEEVKKERKKEQYSLAEGLPECIEAWSQTLSKLRVEKDAKGDSEQIARLIQRHGKENTVLALRGVAYESGTDTFDPAKNVSIFRLTKPHLFDKFVNLGSRHKPAVEQAVEWDLSKVGGA